MEKRKCPLCASASTPRSESMHVTTLRSSLPPRHELQRRPRRRGSARPSPKIEKAIPVSTMVRPEKVLIHQAFPINVRPSKIASSH